MTTPRTLAIGDIHGCLTALVLLLAELQPCEQDTLIVLGDVIDRGPDSCGVLDLLLKLRSRCHLVCLLGNHEQMLLDAVTGTGNLQDWLHYGGAATLDSYHEGAALAAIPEQHIEFLQTWGDFHETPSHFFAHGNFLSEVRLAAQPWEWLRWESLRDLLPGTHCSGKTAILGHTANKRGEILNLGHLICIDTYCHGGGWLTALEPETGKVWQSNNRGEYRSQMLMPPK